LKDGLWTEYFSNGKKCREGEYKADKKEGFWTSWREIYGYILVIQTFSEGELNGCTTQYYSNGNKSYEGHYNNNLKEGLWRRWNKEGDIEETQTYKNGLLHGPLTKHLSNERKNYDQNFKETKTDRGGSLLDNNLTNTEIYKNGKLVE